MAATYVRLYSDWTPADGEAGTLTLTLTNRSDRPLEIFRLAFTSHIQLRSQDELSGARLLEQISGYHVIAPLADFVLTSGATWLNTARGLNYTPRHYSAGLRSAYLILADREIIPVEARGRDPDADVEQPVRPRCRQPASTKAACRASKRLHPPGCREERSQYRYFPSRRGSTSRATAIRPARYILWRPPMKPKRHSMRRRP
jgi:N-acetyl-beta-hexosaminidase